MSYTSSPNGLFSYTISGTSDATEISVIQSAFDKWDSLLTVPDRFLDTGETKYTITVTYSVADLDTGILGSAALQTYRYVTSNTYGNMMPLTGFIQLNTDYTAAMLADVRTSGKTRYYYVVLHEIGHILGIGQFWSTSFSAPLSTYTEDSTTKYYYTGTNAVEQYKSYLTNPEKNLVLGIPVEDEGGTGTKNVHPEEGLEAGVSTDDRYINGVFHPGLNTELMTGWMDGTPDDTPLSRITLGFLADQGYNVNYNDAESFSIIYTNMSYNFDTLRNSGQTDEQIQAAYPNALLDASLGYFNNANKFKESYVKDLLDVSGNMKVYPGYKTLVESSVDGSHNIAGTLHTNTLNIDDNSNLSSNTLSVNGDVSFNKHVTIGGNLTVKGAFKLPDNSLEPTDFSDYDANSTSVGPNEFNFNNSNIFSALDLSGIDVYVAGETTVNANDFKIEGNVYANSIINDEKDNPIIEDNTLINRLDLSNNPFKVKKTYAAANYAAIPEDQYSTVVTPNYNWDFRVASSSSINDSIQNVTATYVSTTSTVENGLAYTGTTGHATLPVGINNGPGENSVEFYIKYTSAFPTSWGTIFAVYTNSNCLLYLAEYANNGNLTVINGDAGNTGTAQPQITNISTTAHLNEWLHIVATYEHTSGDDTCTGRFYANGSLVSTHTGSRKVNDTSTSASTSTGYIGSPVSDSQYNNTGYIRYFRLYNKMLSDTEVSALYSRRDNTDLTSSSVPYISDTGKNMAFTNFTTNGSYITAFSNNYGTSFVDMATRLGGTTTGSHGLLNLHVTDNQKYIYGINPSRGIAKSTNYGHEFTDVSMVSLPDSDLSYSILGTSVFDLSHADTICSSSDGKYTYIGGIIPNSLNQVDYKLIKSSDYGNNFVFDISTNQISIIKQVDLSLNETSVRHLSCSSDGKYVVANIKGVTKANYLMNDLTGTSHPVLSTDYGNNWQLLNSHHFNEYQVLENLDLSFNQNKLKMDCVGLKISKTGRYIACALGSQELTNKMLFYLSSDYGKSFDFKSILNNDNTTFVNQSSLSVDPTYSWEFRQDASNSIKDTISNLTATFFGGLSCSVSDGATFDGTDDYIRLENFELGTTCTLEWYYKFDTIVNGATIFECSSPYYEVDGNTGGSGNNTDILQHYNTSTVYYNMIRNNSTNTGVWGSAAGMDTINTDWAHVVWVFQSNILYTYYNGTLKGTNSSVPFRTITRDNHLIGKSTWTNTAYADMKMAYFRVYQGTALSSAQVTTLYNSREDNTLFVNRTTGANCQINLSPNAEHIATYSTDQGRNVNISTDYGVNWKEVDLSLNGLSAPDSAKSYVSGNLQYLAANQKSSGLHDTNNTFITPYVKTCYTHMVKDNANILNGNASANTDITYSGGVLTASDYRLKSNIQTLSGETLDNLRPVKFNFTHNNHKTFGLIAHELQEEYPYLVDGEKDGANYQTVNYTGLLGLCAHELQQIKKGLEEYD